MRKKFLLLSLCLLSVLSDLCAAVVGGWTTYLAYQDNTFNLSVGRKVYSLCDGNLMSYNSEDGEVRLLSKLDGLSGKYIRQLGYSTSQKQLLLIYDDLDIDIVDEAGGTVENLPQLKNALGSDLKINSLTMCADMAVLATENGIVLVDMAKREIRGYYVLGRQVYAAAVYDGKVFVAYEDEVVSCVLTDNLSDTTLWTAEMQARVRLLQPLGNTLYLSMRNGTSEMPNGTWALRGNGTGYQRSRVSQQFYENVSADASRIVFLNAAGAEVFEAVSPTTPAATYAVANSWKSLSRMSDGSFWASEGASGLQAYRPNAATLLPDGSPIGNYGPARDLCYFMRYAGSRLLVAGGWLDYTGTRHPGTLMTYENGDWNIFEEGEDIETQTGMPYFNSTCIIQDPADENHHFSTTGGTGLYEFRNGKMVNWFSNHNTPLLSAAPGINHYVLTDGLNYDSQGNLWMINNQVDTLFRVLMADGTWAGVYVKEIASAPTLEKTLFDRSGRLWVCSRRTVSYHEAGLLCLDFNGTVRNLDDDVSLYRSTCLNQDGSSVKLNGVYAIVEDDDGEIWVGTGDGLYVIEDPDEWFRSDFTITQIKVPRNDGTNYADYLLAGISVSAIDIDGANRKWIGTYGSGLYLVSADGTEILQHFTAANSPLLSDDIYSIAVNQVTGEVMVGTSVGLCSYQSDASAPAETLSKSQVKVYPNPVRPDFRGTVTVTGLTADADVRITTTGGQAVAGGRSLGGTFTWNVRNQSGDRVSPGVYYIMVSTADAKNGIVAKVVVI